MNIGKNNSILISIEIIEFECRYNIENKIKKRNRINIYYEEDKEDIEDKEDKEDKKGKEDKEDQEDKEDTEDKEDKEDKKR